MKAVRNGGGFYIDIGASELIIAGEIKLRSGVGIERIQERSVILSDGSELPADLIIYAPGTQHSSLFPSYLTPGLSDVEALAREQEAIFAGIPEEAKTLMGAYLPADVAPEKAAAHMMLARSIMNLDEFLTRE